MRRARRFEVAEGGGEGGGSTVGGGTQKKRSAGLQVQTGWRYANIQLRQPRVAELRCRFDTARATVCSSVCVRCRDALPSAAHRNMAECESSAAARRTARHTKQRSNRRNKMPAASGGARRQIDRRDIPNSTMLSQAQPQCARSLFRVVALRVRSHAAAKTSRFFVLKGSFAIFTRSALLAVLWRIRHDTVYTSRRPSQRRMPCGTLSCALSLARSVQRAAEE